MKNITTVNGQLVNPTIFENELNQAVQGLVKAEFSVYSMVAYELNIQSKETVKAIFERIMLDNNFSRATVNRYFTDITKLSALSIGCLSLEDFNSLLELKGIVNMNTAFVWMNRENDFARNVRTISLAKRNQFSIEHVKSVDDLKGIYSDIKKAAAAEAAEAAAAEAAAAEAAAAEAAAAAAEAAAAEAAAAEAAAAEAAAAEAAAAEAAAAEAAAAEAAAAEAAAAKAAATTGAAAEAAATTGAKKLTKAEAAAAKAAAKAAAEAAAEAAAAEAAAAKAAEDAKVAIIKEQVRKELAAEAAAEAAEAAAAKAKKIIPSHELLQAMLASLSKLNDNDLLTLEQAITSQKARNKKRA